MSTALALPTLGASRKLASTPAAGGASAQAPRKRLPAWPLLTLFYGSAAACECPARSGYGLRSSSG